MLIMIQVYHQKLLCSNSGPKFDSLNYQVTGKNNIAKLCTPKYVFLIIYYSNISFIEHLAIITVRKGQQCYILRCSKTISAKWLLAYSEEQVLWFKSLCRSKNLHELRTSVEGIFLIHWNMTWQMHIQANLLQNLLQHGPKKRTRSRTITLYFHDFSASKIIFFQ